MFCHHCHLSKPVAHQSDLLRDSQQILQENRKKSTYCVVQPMHRDPITKNFHHDQGDLHYCGLEAGELGIVKANAYLICEVHKHYIRSRDYQQQ